MFICQFCSISMLLDPDRHSRYGSGLVKSMRIGIGIFNFFLFKGPDEDKIKLILDRTGYSLDVTTGQRKYGGPPPGWDAPSPGNGCEVSGVAEQC